MSCVQKTNIKKKNTKKKKKKKKKTKNKKTTKKIDSCCSVRHQRYPHRAFHSHIVLTKVIVCI